LRSAAVRDGLQAIAMATRSVLDGGWARARLLQVGFRGSGAVLEARAFSRLAGLWQSQGKRQDAYELLAPVYD
jgi:hypothetical protein